MVDRGHGWAGAWRGHLVGVAAHHLEVGERQGHLCVAKGVVPVVVRREELPQQDAAGRHLDQDLARARAQPAGRSAQAHTDLRAPSRHDGREAAPEPTTTLVHNHRQAPGTPG